MARDRYRQKDRQTTDGRATANSERSLKINVNFEEEMKTTYKEVTEISDASSKNVKVSRKSLTRITRSTSDSSPHPTQSRLGRSLPPYQVAS